MICRVGNLFCRQISDRIGLAVHQNLIDVDPHLPDALLADPAPFNEGCDAGRDARGVCARTGSDLLLPYPAPAVLVPVAAQSRQDANVEGFQALIIKRSGRDGGKTAHLRFTGFGTARPAVAGPVFSFASGRPRDSAWLAWRAISIVQPVALAKSFSVAQARAMSRSSSARVSISLPCAAGAVERSRF